MFDGNQTSVNIMQHRAIMVTNECNMLDSIMLDDVASVWSGLSFDKSPPHSLSLETLNVERAHGIPQNYSEGIVVIKSFKSALAGIR